MGTHDTVQEKDLDFTRFGCCGDEDLYPFKCSACGHIMVFCYECDTLYPDLKDTRVINRDTNPFDPTLPAFHCPNCGHEFEYYFIKNPSYHVTFAEWINAGHAGLLTQPCRPKKHA